MRTNKTLRIASVLLIAVLLTTCVIGGTFAKYTTTLNATEATARVAKWEITDGTSALETLTIDNLFATTYDGNGDTSVVSNGTDKLVAPGTTGTVTFPKIVNNSEVAVEYTVTVTIEETTTGGDIPLTYTATGWTVAEGNTTTNYTYTYTGQLAANGGAIDGKVMTWAWAFAETDETSLGTAATSSTVTVNASIVVNQLDTYTAAP